MRTTEFVIAGSLFALLVACAKQGEERAPVAAPPAAEAELVKDEVKKEELSTRYMACVKAFENRDEEAFRGCYAGDAVAEIADAVVIEGRDAWMDATKAHWSAFGEEKFTPTVVLAKGNKVFSLVYWAGTNTGALKLPGGKEIPTTNGSVGMYLMQAVTFNDKGEIASDRHYVNLACALEQLNGARPIDPAPTEPTVIATATEDDKEAANLELLKTADAAFNAHDADKYLSLYTDDVRAVDIGIATFDGMEAFTGKVTGLAGAFPDGRVEIVSEWTAGDYVVAEFVYSGTNNGPLPPMITEPTKKALKVKLIELRQVEGGKFSKMWLSFNALAFATQLGLIPEEKK